MQNGTKRKSICGGGKVETSDIFKLCKLYCVDRKRPRSVRSKLILSDILHVAFPGLETLFCGLRGDVIHRYYVRGLYRFFWLTKSSKSPSSAPPVDSPPVGVRTHPFLTSI